MSKWGSLIAECIVDETMRVWLRDIPLTLVSSVEYEPDYIYWAVYIPSNRN